MATTYYYTVDGLIEGESTSGVYTDYLTDALGSVTATVNSSAAVVNTYRYKPSGGLLAKTGVGDDPRFLWNGRSGYLNVNRAYASDYVRKRTYAREAGCWTTRDLLWPAMSAMGYAAGNPVTYSDYYGLTHIAIEVKAFLHRRMGLWMKEPGPTGALCEYRGDYRLPMDAGSSRIETRIDITSCAIGQQIGMTNQRGMSHSRCRNEKWEWVYEDAMSFEVANKRGARHFHQIGGPCRTEFTTLIAAAYPFLPGVAPTSIAVDGAVSVTGKGSITLSLKVKHTLFPDYEVILIVDGKRQLLDHYKTQYPNWILAFPFLSREWNTKLGIKADTECCCTEIPCCLEECPCPG